jgi:DNA helicase-2/ATP-dependent DNA helicase PcrA
MTLHAAKGLEFDVVFLPGWEEGLFPHQRSLDENGTAGLEEERRLAYVGLTRARRKAKVSFVQNRRTRGLWQPATASRFVDELPEEHLDIVRARGPRGGAGTGYANPYGRSRFEEPGAGFNSGYATPGWQRARQQWSRDDRHPSAGPRTVEARLVASSSARGAGFARGERVFHEKFGYGLIAAVDGNKLTVEFDKAGEKRVLDSFVTRA